jgi:glycosyltransferase involved in cell wall biosynthesis
VGDIGVVVPPRCPEALAAGIEQLRDRLAREGDAPRNAARKRVIEEYGVEKLVARTEQALIESARGAE